MTSVTSILASSDAATSAAAALANNSSSTTSTDSASGDQDTFLKLMVAQLKYQNPDSPTDGTQYLAETAQFTQVQKLDTLSDKLDELVQEQQQASATGLIGRTVTYTEHGATKTGEVTGVTTSGGAASLTVGSDDVALGDVSSVTATPTA